MTSPLEAPISIESSLSAVIERTELALRAEGFGVLTRIDVHATLREKLNVDFRPYVILGACNPALAYQSLSIEPAMGLFLPCNLVVEEVEAGRCLVRIQQPSAMLGPEHAEGLHEVAREAEARLERVANRLSQV